MTKLSENSMMNRLVQFCLEQGSPCLDSWSFDQMRSYLEWHGFNRSLWWTRCQDEIAGLCVGYQCDAADADKDWQTHNPKGETFYIALLVSAKQGAISSITRSMLKQFPSWRQFKIIMHRDKLGSRLLKTCSPRYIRSCLNL